MVLHPALFRVFVFCFLINVNHSFLSLTHLEVFQGDVKVAGVFIFLSMVNLNLMPLKKSFIIVWIMYKYWKESKLWVWNWASLDRDQASVWTADASGFGQAWHGDALCMYIGLSVGELREAEPIRNPSQDIDLAHSFSSLLDRLSVYVSDGV